MYVVVSSVMHLILFIILNKFQMNSVRIFENFLVFNLIINYIIGKTSKKNMYQAINDAMDLVLSKDSNSGKL